MSLFIRDNNMEISKEHSIFSIIDKHYSLIEEDCETYIKFTNTLNWSDSVYENFINVMKSLNYGEEIDKQKLEIYCDETVLKVSGNTNIIKYCHNSKYNSKNFEWYKNKVISKDIVDDLLDSKLNF